MAITAPKTATMITEQHSTINEVKASSLSLPIRFSLILLGAALLLSVLLRWGMQIFTLSEINFNGSYDTGLEIVGKLPSWYNLPMYMLFFSIALIAGVIFLTKLWKKMPLAYIAAYIGMWLYSIFLLLVLSKSPAPYISTMTGLMSKMAPGTILAIAIFFLASNRYAWQKIQLYLLWVLFICVALSIFGYSQIDHVSRALGMRWIWAPSLGLELLAVLPIAIYSNRSLIYRWLSYCPIAVLTISGLILQTRLIFISLFIQIIVFSFLRVRARIKHKTIGFVSLGLWVGFIIFFVFGILPLVASFGNDSLIAGSAQAFVERMDHTEHRTAQIAPFFVKFWDVFPLGLGYPGPGQSNGEAHEGDIGMDSGYLVTMYVTGVPMMACYVVMLVIPVLRALMLKRTQPTDAAVIACAFTYVIRMTSSTVPNMDFDFIIYILLAGRCAYLVSKPKLGSIKSYS